jgi:hypothetical protein
LILQERNFTEIEFIRLLDAQPSAILEIMGKSDEETRFFDFFTFALRHRGQQHFRLP